MFPERRIGRQVSFPQNMKGQKTRAIVDMMASAQLSKHNQGYTSSNSDGVALEDWFSGSGVQTLYDPNQPNSFFTGRWDITSNPDLLFAKFSGQ